MNHYLIKVEVTSAPTVRYPQDNKTPIAEMEVSFAGLRPDDNPSQLKVIGWGNMAQELHQKISNGQKLVIEGRLRMNTVSRNDGTKEKVAELTLSRFHHFSSSSNSQKAIGTPNSSSSSNKQQNQTGLNSDRDQQETSWNSAPLVPDTDEIPF